MSIEHNVQDLVNRQVEAGEQIGVQVCAYSNGVKVVDIVAGTMGPEDARPVENNTLFGSFSCTKGPTALAIHQLVDRGQLDYDAKVVDYWPAFGAHGKDKLTVAQAVSHQTGLYALPQPFSVGSLIDWDAGLRRIEDGVPAFEPGTAGAYDAVTFGWIAGGIIEAASGRPIGEYLKTEIAEPLGVEEEFYVGIPDAASVTARLSTVAMLPAGSGLGLAPDSPTLRAMPPEMWESFNTMQVRTACIPSANGHFSARGLARMYGALANGGEIDGARLVSPERIASMYQLESHQLDIVAMVPIRRSAGFILGESVDVPGVGPIHGLTGPNESAFGHGGAGGSIGYADPDNGLAMAVTINKMAWAAPGTGATLEICDLIRSHH